MLHRQRQPSRLSSVRVVPSLYLLCFSCRVHTLQVRAIGSLRCSCASHAPGAQMCGRAYCCAGGEIAKYTCNRTHSLAPLSTVTIPPFRSNADTSGETIKLSTFARVVPRPCTRSHCLLGCMHAWQTDGISAPHSSLSTAGPPLVLLQRSSTVTTTPRCCISSAWTRKNMRWHDYNCVEEGGGDQRGTSHPFLRRRKSSRKASSRRT
jgi:hypothetical protein